MTALGNPQLLERMSAALLEIRTLFKEADSDGGCSAAGSLQAYSSFADTESVDALAVIKHAVIRTIQEGHNVQSWASRNVTVLTITVNCSISEGVSE